jgi:hypothetical protein
MVSVGYGTAVIAFGSGPIFAPEQELECIRIPTGFLTTLCHSLLIMTKPLSPAARAVLNAASCWAGESNIAAAALRVAALYCKRDALQLLAIADELEGNA